MALAVLIALVFGLDGMYTFFLKQNKNLKSSYVASSKIDADVLILGDCVPMYMQPPDKLIGLRSFNLATNHSSFAEHLAHFHLYLKNNKPPQYLFIYVNSKTMDGKFNTYNSYLFAQWRGDPAIDSITKAEDPAYYRVSAIPFMRYAFYNRYMHFNMVQGAKHYFTDREKPYYESGYARLRSEEWDNYFERFIKTFPDGRRFEWSEKEEYYLKKLVQLAKTHGAKVIFFEPPILAEVRPYFLNEDQIRERLIQFSATNDAKYWRFDTMDISRSRKYFFTIFNTNREGSAIFVKRLSEQFNRTEKRP